MVARTSILASAVFDARDVCIGNLYLGLPDERGNMSQAVTCRHHGCKKRTTYAKHPSRDGALRWLEAGRHLDRAEHMKRYPFMVLPEEHWPKDR